MHNHIKYTWFLFNLSQYVLNDCIRLSTLNAEFECIALISEDNNMVQLTSPHIEVWIKNGDPDTVEGCHKASQMHDAFHEAS